MSYRLFLDDVRTIAMVPQLPQNADWTIVRNYDDFVKVITARGLPSFISFDHDLADVHYASFEKFMKGAASYKELYENCKEKTGYHCAKWLIDYCLDNDKKLPLYFVHSANPAGRDNINGILNSFKQFQTSQSENEE
jgi:hypothetical protein